MSKGELNTLPGEAIDTTSRPVMSSKYAKSEYWPIGKLKPWDRNPRSIKDDRFKELKARLSRQGQIKPLLVTKDGTVIGGNMRLRAFTELGWQEVWVSVTEAKTDKDIFDLALTDNEEFGYYEQEQLAELALSIGLTPLELKTYEVNLGDPISLDLLLNRDTVETDEDRSGNLSKSFIIPPFSIFDTKQGYWQDRRRSWLSLGIKSEEGRAKGLLGADDNILAGINEGTSVFDPVLCEIGYRWFNVDSGSVLDPFAGGSVRGVVAGRLGYQYVGHELRKEQVDANRQQALELCDEPMPVWIDGDSNKTLDTNDGTYDMLFSCPPYADLEVYSDDPDDLSNMPYEQFLDLYRSIIAKSCAKLNNDRFAVWVIGEVRAKNGEYYNFVGDTIRAFRDAGLSYYNEIILVNSAGTLPLRAGRQFNNGRKIGKQHQNVLVFYKGNIKNIKAKYGELDFSELETEESEESLPNPSTL